MWFGAVYGSSCPIRLDDVAVDTDREPALVHAVTVVPGGTGACTADANPHAYVVAIDRTGSRPGRSPSSSAPTTRPPGRPEERTLVDADLTVPGAVADADDIGPDDELIEASQQAAAGGERRLHRTRLPAPVPDGHPLRDRRAR